MFMNHHLAILSNFHIAFALHDAANTFLVAIFHNGVMFFEMAWHFIVFMGCSMQAMLSCHFCSVMGFMHFPIGVMGHFAFSVVVNHYHYPCDGF